MTRTQEMAARLTSEILGAYLSHNSVPADDLPALMANAYAAIEKVMARAPSRDPRIEKPTPEQIRASVTDDAITSFEDGKRYRTLKRHLTRLGLTVAEYKAKWGLPDDYPVCAKSFSDLRSATARSHGLGRGLPVGRGAQGARIAAHGALADDRPDPAAARARRG
jgi:predicted transcriptional regulator